MGQFMKQASGPGTFRVAVLVLLALLVVAVFGVGQATQSVAKALPDANDGMTLK